VAITQAVGEVDTKHAALTPNPDAQAGPDVCVNPCITGKATARMGGVDEKRGAHGEGAPTTPPTLRLAGDVRQLAAKALDINPPIVEYRVRPEEHGSCMARIAGRPEIQRGPGRDGFEASGDKEHASATRAG
jgi:hypothetical protein